MRAVRDVSVIVRLVVEIDRRNAPAAASIVASSCAAVAGASADDGAIKIACSPALTRGALSPTSERNDANDAFAAESCSTVTVGGFGWIGASVVTICDPLSLVSNGAFVK